MTGDQITAPTYQGLQSVWQHFMALVPQLIAGLVLLVVGAVLGYIVCKLASKLLKKTGLDHFLDTIGIGHWIGKFGIKQSPSQILGWLTGTFIFLVFLVAAVDALGLDSIARLLDSFTAFLPKLVGAMLIFVVGCAIAQTIFNAVRNTTGTMGIDYGRSVAEVVRGLVLLITLSVAVSQLELELELLNWLIAVLCASVGLGAALALGLGTRSLASEIIAGVYLREMYSAGDHLLVEDVDGTLAGIGTVASRIVNANSVTVTLPNSVLLRRRVEKLPATT